jgi:hypothetical protein
VENDTKQPTDQERADAFMREYEALCKKHSLRLVVSPAFRYMADTNVFAITQQINVGPLPAYE